MSRAESSGTPFSAFALLTLRVLLGGIFAWAGVAKLMAMQSLLESIQAFRLVHSEQLQVLATYAMPPVEILAGLALIFGIWTREAAVVIGLLLVVFIGAIIAGIARHLGDFPCSCFGYWHLYCQGVVGWCKVVENLVLTSIAGVLVVAGGGTLALCRPAAASEPAYA